MPINCFLDTNVLVYAAAGKRDDPRKAGIARQIVATEIFGVSAQTLAEFYDVVSGKAEVPIFLAEIDAWIERLSAFPFAVVDAESSAQGFSSRDASASGISTRRCLPPRNGLARRSSIPRNSTTVRPTAPSK